MINASEAAKLSDENGSVAVQSYLKSTVEPGIRKTAEYGKRNATFTTMPPYQVQDKVIAELNSLGYKAKIHNAMSQLDNSYLEVSW